MKSREESGRIRNYFTLLFFCFFCWSEAWLLTVHCSLCRAAPFLVCNPVTGATSYNVSGLPSSIAGTNLPPDADGTYGFALDLSALPSGAYTVTVTACLTDVNFGQECSAPSSPFSFSRPSPPAVPTGMGLSTKQ